MINERVSAAIRTAFAINGDLSVVWSREPDEGGWRAWVPWPHIVANDISVATPSGPGRRNSRPSSAASSAWRCLLRQRIAC